MILYMERTPKVDLFVGHNRLFQRHLPAVLIQFMKNINSVSADFAQNEGTVH